MFQAPRIEWPEIERYWNDPPPELSTRCLYWQWRINAGWRPNKRVRRMGYYEATKYFGVYVWEYLNVISPLLNRLGGL